ncbi:MAG: PP2C family protein-serine/threonine phosphatase [Thermoanaerobaculia bacterium]
MKNPRSLALWLLAGVAGLVLLAWAYPRAFPLLPQRWAVSRAAAVDVALERLRDMGEPVRDPYVVAQLSRDILLERRLQLAVDGGRARDVWASELPGHLVAWRVHVYPPGAQRYDWTYEAVVSLAGKVLGLRHRLEPEAKGAPIQPQEARAQADAFLAKEGIDLSHYAPPEVRSQQLAARTDLTLRYRDRRNPLAAGSFHGVEVFFGGDRLTGFGDWLDDPREKVLIGEMRGLNILGLLRVVWFFVLAGLLAVPFLKRYHEGEIGVRRGVQIFLVVAVLGLLLVLLTSRVNSEDSGAGSLTREQNTWVVVLFELVFMILPAALLASLAWSVGESICRERWGHKLAAFDALFQGDLANGTVARSSFRGWMAGLATAGGMAALLVAFRQWGGWASSAAMMRADSRWPGVELVADGMAVLFPFLLTAVLWILPVSARRLGVWWGSLAAVLAAAVVVPPMALAVPLGWTVAVALVPAAVLVPLFLATDLLTTLLSGFVAVILFMAYPFLTAEHASLQFQGWLALGLLAIPLVASVRHLGSSREFEYRYEDVPPHVRRIAERERQRVELETARGIQSSILPDLPPRLAGVDLAHAYLPATEVGGDFYDVLALEDGRLAVAVGDVAGHGVSSGLIMSMAKSALAVQVTFDPEVAAVFSTMNRTVFQTARKRLLTTLCYAVVDPRRLEMFYASAGHLHPYRISAAGQVEPLESIAYPLGVRGALPVEVRTAKLAPGDTLFLFSDGVVEARREGTDEMFGFERLEASLARHVGRGPEATRDGVLGDVARFTAGAPREDDQTVLVLRLP